MDTNGHAGDSSATTNGSVEAQSPLPVTNGVDVEGDHEEGEDTWEWFNILRTMCDTPKRVGVCLELSADLLSDAR